MALQDRQCPNCGASVDFGGGTQTTCSFCRSVLSLSPGEIQSASTLNDLLNGRPVRPTEFAPTSGTPQPAPPPAPHWTDFNDVAELARRGRKAEAIQLYRERTGVGVNEARYIVEAMAWDTTAVSLPASTPVHNHKALLLGCLPALVFISVCAAFMLLSSQALFRVWGPLDQTLQIINNDFQVKHVFGQPVTSGLLITGEINGGDKVTSARFSVPISGPKRRGELRVNGVWRKDRGWDLTIRVIYTEAGAEHTITLVQKVK